ncbi:hypothetical protein LX97_03450 [Nonlabens dokdonensis]|uniref:Transposase n=1 Tax=Nonlabens dokdonensis TaxID=328515 RepID=A0ABX5PTY2_9FLAO|nr:hypothetical protein LX97_03450 [Nonlabens dokdonensis]
MQLCYCTANLEILKGANVLMRFSLKAVSLQLNQYKNIFDKLRLTIKDLCAQTNNLLKLKQFPFTN